MRRRRDWRASYGHHRSRGRWCPSGGGHSVITIVYIFTSFNQKENSRFDLFGVIRSVVGTIVVVVKGAVLKNK